MNKLMVGRSYKVSKMSNDEEIVTIKSIIGKKVTLTDLRTAKIVMGATGKPWPFNNGRAGEPDKYEGESVEEVIRLDEIGCVARGGIVRACAII